ncbi:YggS family pyridoxal phosphate-dependent enzyme [Candidatus Gracilibacteria bacterium]|nr:YggS family pyridoxal phosphate-dependent enzyme [Candidatus Gracilibacteria bacterium]
MNSPKKNLENFNCELIEVCRKFDRNPAEIHLIAVTKNRSASEANELIKAGVEKIGENRLQEATEKFPNLEKCEKHFIGNIQSNKAREIAQLFDCVESVSSVKVARILDTEAQAIGKILPIFLQVNLAKESQKNGFLEKNLAEAVTEIRELPNLKIEGLMVMGIFGDVEKTREVFSCGKKLCEKFGFKNFSAGMSDDWKIAVKEGTDFLRIGRRLFKC